MKLLLINPNTTRAMTDNIAAAARQVAGSGTVVFAVQPSFGPATQQARRLRATPAEG